jgi:hypothetical protein
LLGANAETAPRRRIKEAVVFMVQDERRGLVE